MSDTRDPLVTFLDRGGTRLATGYSKNIPRTGDIVTFKERLYQVDRVTLDYEHVKDGPDMALVVRRATVELSEWANS